MVRDEAADATDRIAARRQAAIAKWHSTPQRTGNQAFFQLGVDLRSTGMSLPEIGTTLRQEAGQARHPFQRRDQVKGIMRTLMQQPNRAVA